MGLEIVQRGHTPSSESLVPLENGSLGHGAGRPAVRNQRDDSAPKPPAPGEGEGSETTAVVESTHDTYIAILVSAPGQLAQGPLPSGRVATIWVGAYEWDGSLKRGVQGEDLDVEVERPDGTVETLPTQTTDSNGTASVDYDLSDPSRGDGVYDFTVADADEADDTATVSETVGPTVTCTSDHDQHLFNGEEATVAFLVHDGADGVQGESLTLTVSDGSGTVNQTTTTSDADGFATISFTPSQTGTHTVEADHGGNLTSTTFEVVDRLGRWTNAGIQALVGATNSFGGYLDGPSGPIGNTTLDVAFYRDAARTDLETEQTVTTNASGFFVAAYDLPEAFSGGDTLYPAAELTDGTPVPLSKDRIDVVDPTSGGGGGPAPDVVLTATTDFQHAPGEQVTIDITATDDGSPISGQSVDIYLGYGFDGPPFYSTTVTTESDGTATTSTSLPTDAPDGFPLSGRARMDYGGDTWESFIFSEIQQYDIRFQQDTDIAPGATATHELDVFESSSGDRVDGIPDQFDAVYTTGLAGSFGHGKLVSSSAGSDQVDVAVPTDIGFEPGAIQVHRYLARDVLFTVGAAHPGSLSTNDTIVAGEDAQFDFQTPGGETLHGMVFGWTTRPDEKTFASLFDGPGTFTVPIPTQYQTGDTGYLEAWAIDDAGTLHRATTSFTVDIGGLSISASGESGVPVGGGATISISASQVETITIADLWTDWGIASANPDGGTLTDDVASAGEVTITYSSEQTAVAPSLTVALPGRYVGGTYGVTVTGTNATGDTVEATATVTIS